MRNYDIIKKVFEITQIDNEVKPWDYEELSEAKLKEIQELIADERPCITGPKFKKIKN